MASNIPFPPTSNASASVAVSPGMSIEIPHRSDEHRKEQQHTSRTFHHHPRQPGPSSDSYFSGSLTSTANTAPPRTPGSWRGHSRNVSSTSAMLKSQPMSTGVSAPNGPPHPDFGGQWTPQPQSSWGGFRGGGLPSPSTLTDILLGLHSTLYGGKKSAEEVREMVWRYYDADATFESPLLSASGREQVANQFIMAFALPGLDVTSELRDVICSDFEFDGTRAGIIDQTISVTILPSIFGSAEVPHAYASSSQAYATPAHHNSVTPHPFADYKTPGASAFSHAQHSPTTPYSVLSSMWGGGASRPHTPGAGPWSASASGIRPFTSSAHPRAETPPSVNGEDEDASTVRYSAEQAGGGAVSRLMMPLDAVTPHWGSQGLGRSTFGSLLWGLFHPRAVLRNLCTIQLRLMSRLEFNDAGQIVRHEDTWGLRETIEGTIPFASLLYALERRVIGYITSWAVGKGFSLSSALHPRAIHGPVHESELALLDGRQQRDADEAAHALLGRARGSGFQQHEHFQTISRSRAPSPTRMGWSASSTSTPMVTGTRSRARSSAGSFYGGSRTASSENLYSLGHSGFATGFERGADKDLPPDSSARYRSLGRRLDGGRATSTTSAPPSEIAGSSEEYVRSKAPDRDPSL